MMQYIFDLLINLFIYDYDYLYYPFYINSLSEYSYSYHLYYTWFRFIKSYTENTSHGFLAKWQMVHNQFINLGNPIGIVVHYLQIEGMTYLNYQDSFPMMSIVVCMITYWTRLMVNYDINYQVIIIHEVTILYRLLTLKGYWICVEINKRFCPIGESLRWSHIPSILDHYW